jgi:hypothetical protein
VLVPTHATQKPPFGGVSARFFDEHVEADSVHENIAVYDMAQGLAQSELGARGEIAARPVASAR